jgi:hypothetical protein
MTCSYTEQRFHFGPYHFTITRIFTESKANIITFLKSISSNKNHSAWREKKNCLSPVTFYVTEFDHEHLMKYKRNILLV